MNFWQAHSLLFLFGITFFPRITTLFFTFTPYGLLSWIGWLFTPHLLVAILATSRYWDTNPVLCIIAWMVAIGGTSAEGEVAAKSSTRK